MRDRFVRSLYHWISRFTVHTLDERLVRYIERHPETVPRFDWSLGVSWWNQPMPLGRCRWFILSLLVYLCSRTSNETDETDCELWPCNERHTHCNGYWNRPNGCDELNCSVQSIDDKLSAISEGGWWSLWLSIRIRWSSNVTDQKLRTLAQSRAG